MTLRPIVLLVLASVACKSGRDSCDPGQVQWGVQLQIQASQLINPDPNGEALPTVVRLYQVKGELAMDDLDFATLWASEDPKSLGERFLSAEEMTIYPGQADQRLLPVEQDATHIIAAAWFREPLGNTWFGTYEIPRRHPEVVCSEAPQTRQYPNPCVYVLLDRSLVSGGATPPSGFNIQAGMKCAPPGVVPGPRDKKKKKGKKKKGELGAPEDLLDENAPKPPDAAKPSLPDTPRPGMPEQPSVPRGPAVPEGPPADAPARPSAPK